MYSKLYNKFSLNRFIHEKVSLDILIAMTEIVLKTSAFGYPQNIVNLISNSSKSDPVQNRHRHLLGVSLCFRDISLMIDVLSFRGHEHVRNWRM